MFDRYIGVAYSGAKAPVSRLPALQVFAASPTTDPVRVPGPPAGSETWCRKDLARWCVQELSGAHRAIVGMGHAFSFPRTYMERHALRSWPQFLEHFGAIWPTDRDHTYVDFIRAKNPPSGGSDEFRLCEQWVGEVPSVFQFSQHGDAGSAAHAGIAWLSYLRQQAQIVDKMHFWPLDGFDVPEQKSVVCEVLPRMFSRRYPSSAPSNHAHQAYAVTMWLKYVDRRGALRQYFNPPLTLPERRLAELEGWFLGAY